MENTWKNWNSHTDGDKVKHSQFKNKKAISQKLPHDQEVPFIS